ncbi:hypothetical protein CW304_29820 [Bacillus sp. UFRGS-B20]|nr:hypothetical protein CW304_29820 [Bacillus sp. UFRGS-B20]
MYCYFSPRTTFPYVPEYKNLQHDFPSLVEWSSIWPITCGRILIIRFHCQTFLSHSVSFSYT